MRGWIYLSQAHHFKKAHRPWLQLHPAWHTKTPMNLSAAPAPIAGLDWSVNSLARLWVSLDILQQSVCFKAIPKQGKV